MEVMFLLEFYIFIIGFSKEEQRASGLHAVIANSRKVTLPIVEQWYISKTITCLPVPREALDFLTHIDEWYILGLEINFRCYGQKRHHLDINDRLHANPNRPLCLIGLVFHSDTVFLFVKDPIFIVYKMTIESQHLLVLSLDFIHLFLHTHRHPQPSNLFFERVQFRYFFDRGVEVMLAVVPFNVLEVGVEFLEVFLVDRLTVEFMSLTLLPQPLKGYSLILQDPQSVGRQFREGLGRNGELEFIDDLSVKQQIVVLFELIVLVSQIIIHESVLHG